MTQPQAEMVAVPLGLPYRRARVSRISPSVVNGDANVLEAVCALAPQIAAAADRTERDRRLPAEIVQALVGARVFRLCIPASLDGAETSPATMVRVIEAIACADGAAGWSAAIGATSGVTSAYLPLPTAREIYGPADEIGRAHV